MSTSLELQNEKSFSSCFRFDTTKESPAESMSKAANEEGREKMEKLFKITHALVKNSQALVKMEFQRKLLTALQKRNELGETYNNDKAPAEFAEYISKAAYAEWADKVRKFKFVSITGDESCDFAVREQGAWCMKAAHHGEVIEGFMGIAHLPKADAAGTYCVSNDFVYHKTKVSIPKIINFFQKV